MLTGGSDNLIKIWDYEAQKTVPFFYQAFIGHTFPISDVMFNPCDNNTVISTDPSPVGKTELHVRQRPLAR